MKETMGISTTDNQDQIEFNAPKALGLGRVWNNCENRWVWTSFPVCQFNSVDFDEVILDLH